jgi:signal peptidase II
VSAVSTREQVERAIARRERRQAQSRWIRASVLAVTVLALDQATKLIVRGSMDLRQSIDVLPGLSLTRVNNTGIAFGLFPGRVTIVSVLTLIALCAIAGALAGLVSRNPLVAAGAGMLVGGSLGNLIDRLVYGAVTDFLDPVRWPAFNIADIGIVVGATLIVFGLLREEPHQVADDEP